MARIAGVTPEETRERLIDAAARVFERDGFERTTVAEIAREAGVTTGAIYPHYPGKAALLLDALRVHSSRATASLLPPGRRADAAEVLVTLASNLDTRRRPDTALLIEALLAARRDDELDAVLATALARRESAMAELFVHGQDAGKVNSRVSAAAAARFSMMVGIGSMLMNELDLPEVDKGEWKVLMREVIAAFSEERPA